MTEVLWREWGEEAFAEAQALDRPILLDIGAVWCHWCHVMDHGIPGDPVHTGTYSDPNIAAAINRDYIPVKVDNDRRPDINARYNMGGWPTTAFLTPDGEPLYGATYLTPSQMKGLIESIAEYYHGNKDEIVRKVTAYSEKQKQALLAPKAAGELSPEIGDFVAAEIKRSFDPAFGGFGMQPKFPHPDALMFAMERFAAANDDDLRIVATKTLVEMASGGMYDQYAGGFFRYSTTRDWSIPHYEKMLEDNCRLLPAYLHASNIFGDDRFQEIAADVKRFLMDVMYDRGLGAFAGSQDADEEETYYGRPLSEREAMPTPYIDRTFYVDWNALAVTAFVALYTHLGDKEALVVATQLFDFLAGRVAPYHYFVDGVGQGPRNLFSDITTLTGAAIDLYEATGIKRYLSDARGLADVAYAELFDEYAGQFRDTPETPGAAGSLRNPHFDPAQNAQMARQLIRLAGQTSSAKYRNLSERCLKAISASYRSQSYFSSAFARATAAFLAPETHIVIVGDQSALPMQNLKFAAHRAFAWNKTIELCDPESSGAYPPDPEGRPIAYVCVGSVCSEPTCDLDKLGKLIKAGPNL